MSRTSEYIDYPHIVHIDGSFGAEYDPYPDNRTRQGPVRSIASPSWILTGNHQPPAASTPMATTTNVFSPVPTVHRLTQNDDPARTSMPFGSPVSLHGMSQTRPADPVTMPWLTSSPTNVSYPATTRGTWLNTSGQAPPMRINDHGSLFQPMQASTPAPSQYGGDPRSYPNTPPPKYGYTHTQSRPRQYGAVVAAENDTDLHRSSLEQEQEFYQEQQRYAQSPPQEVDENELDIPEDSAAASEAEEELVPMNVMVDNGQEDMLGTMPNLVTAPPLQTKSKKKFVGGFWSGLKNFTGFGPKPSLAPLSIPVPTPAQPPPIRRVSRADTSNAGSIRLFEGAQRSPDAIFPHPELSHSADHTPESHGPLTPDDQLEQSENPITIPDQIDDTQLLPNPHDDTLITAPVNPQTPQEVDLQPTADYDAMSEPTEEELPDTTLSSHINRMGKFITDLIHLPWISPTSISEAYSPAESRRARYTGPKPGTSWYTKENHEKLDLLATPTQTHRRHYPSGTRPRLQTRPSDLPGMPAHRRPATTGRRTREPLSGGTDISSLDSRMSPGHRPRHGPGLTISSLSPTTSPRVGVGENVPQAMSPYSYYYTSPLYVYPSPLGSPHVQATGAGVSTSRRRGRSGSDGAAGQPTPMPIPMPIPFQMPGMNMAVAGGNGQQGVPAVYMIAPAPIVLPSSNSPSRQHTHNRRGSRRNERERETGSRSSAASPRNSNPTTSNVRTSRRASNANLRSTQPHAQVTSGSTSTRATSRSPGPAAAGKQSS